MNSPLSVNDQLKQIITPGGKSYYHVQLQKARMMAIVLSLASVGTLIFLVFAFVQKAAADTAREDAIRNERLAREQELRAKQFEVQLQHCMQAK
jgi:hypothetical protein